MIDLVKVFEDTREISLNDYGVETKNLISNTKLYRDPINEIDIGEKTKLNSMVRLVSMKSVTSAKLIATDYKIAILNFADALVPGGLVKEGARTQEEDLCRCSNLYESLLNTQEYYKINRDCGNYFYTDAIIYSPDVLFFKDDNSYDRVNQRYFDVITCPAPSSQDSNNLETIIQRRTDSSVLTGVANNVNVLVLGAWGCGAFGNDAKLVFRCFLNSLKKYPYFNCVVFPIISGKDSYIYKSFKQVFGKY